MGLRTRKIHALSLLFFLAAAFCAGAFLLAQDFSIGSYFVVNRYILPRYSSKGKLQCIIYGNTAINEGSLIHLAFKPDKNAEESAHRRNLPYSPVAIMLDFVDGSYTSIRQVQTIKPEDPYPTPYKLGTKEKTVRDWWNREQCKHSQAWVFVEQIINPGQASSAAENGREKNAPVIIASFDKNTNILASDETAFFRSRQLDADGVGFDAFSDRKFIHIRSDVRAIIHLGGNGKKTDVEANPGNEDEDDQESGVLFASDNPAEVQADAADIDLENNVITLIGNVVVDDHKNRITCARMEIYMDKDAADTLVGSADKPNAGKQDDPEDEDEDDGKKNSIRKIVCIGDVVSSMYDESSGKKRTALCERAEYDVPDNEIVMTGAHSAPGTVIPEDVFGVMQRRIRANIISACPVMFQEKEWMVGSRITILLNENNRVKVRDVKVNYSDSMLAMKERNESGADKNTDGEKDQNATMISADDADINLENDLITLTGNVDIDDQSSRITCREMEIVLNGDKESAGGKDNDGEENMFGSRSVSKVICKGDVVYLERAKPDDPDGKSRIALADRADYDAVTETIVLTGKELPTVMQGSDRLRGERIEIFSKEDNRVKIRKVEFRIARNLLSQDGSEDSGATSTTVTADDADIRLNEKITLSKNVFIDGGDSRMNCGRMEIFLLNDESKQADKLVPDTQNEFGNSISKIVCSNDVIYRRNSGAGEQVVLSREADYDAVSEVIVMSGAHSNPKNEIPRDLYAEIEQSVGRDAAPGKRGGFGQCSIMMQGENWIAGTPITIHPKEGNRIKITAMKAGLRQNSGKKTETPEGK